MYRLGQKLRHLYNSFLSPVYHGSQILPQSTLVDRTMASAATLLAGLYPPMGRQQWHPNITWQPVPIYPNLLDKALLVLEPEQCPRYLHEQNVSVQAIPTVQLGFHDLHDVYAAMSAGTGRNITSLSQMFILYQNLAALEENNMALPEWAEPIFKSRIVPIVSHMIRHTTMRNMKMIKILIGPFLDSMLNLLQQRPEMVTAEQVKERLRMLVHVGHDITIMCLMAVLGYKEEDIPEASESLVLEVHHNSVLPSEYQLQVFKINGRANSTEVPELLELPNCKSPCDLHSFIEMSRKFTTKDWNQECLDMTSGSDR
ncbi:lysosomal acid phosphatase-like isoform X2 [Macrosteles quadrilineatus]|nr:lysosomal acid phosphatase-like isoform X2 [Macrosteles quadrilineatus]